MIVVLMKANMSDVINEGSQGFAVPPIFLAGRKHSLRPGGLQIYSHFKKQTREVPLLLSIK